MTTGAWASIIIGQSIGLVLLGLQAFWRLRDAVRDTPNREQFDDLRTRVERVETKMENGVSAEIKQIRADLAAVRPMCQRHGEELARLTARLEFEK